MSVLGTLAYVLKDVTLLGVQKRSQVEALVMEKLGAIPKW